MYETEDKHKTHINNIFPGKDRFRRAQNATNKEISVTKTKC